MLEKTLGIVRSNVKSTPEMLDEIFTAVRRFAACEISLVDWIKLDSPTRSTLAGSIAGNFAAHHPKECYELLRSVAQRITKDSDNPRCYEK